ncbi:MAG TPA: site-specific integrase, partial [Frankiaceae bacterium]|nr:site-specific integrase [Frankiaceae bacterium]
MEQLTPADVRTFLREQASRPGARGRLLSARTIQYLHAVLRRALEHARRDELVVRNVAALVEPPRVRREEVVPLSVDDAR